MLAQLTRSPSGFAGFILVVLIVGMAFICPLFVAQPISNVELAWDGPSPAAICWAPTAAARTS